VPNIGSMKYCGKIYSTMVPATGIEPAAYYLSGACADGETVRTWRCDRRSGADAAMSVALSTFDAADWLRQTEEAGLMVSALSDGRIVIGAAITDAHDVSRRIEAAKAPLYDRPNRKASVRALLLRKGLAVAPPD
jgi:hypothetical protein